LIGLFCFIHFAQPSLIVEKEGVKMTLQDYVYRNVPEYYPDMWRDGFTPYEVMAAFKKQMYQAYDERTMVDEVKISSEVKLK
jgi:hypothetical protein